MWEAWRRWFCGEAPDVGHWGESAAAAWLRRERGFEIVARNWRDPRDRRGEIDLVAREGPVLVFVEVKTREEGRLVSGRHAVDGRKRRALRRVCDAYLLALPPAERPRTFRFDLVEVGHLPGERGEPVVRHFANVPLFRRYYRR
jgi:putative endonuclease